MNTLPKELKIYIMEYDADHRVNFKKALREIPIKGALSRFKGLDREYLRRAPLELTSYEHIINDCMSDKLHLDKILRSCRCCHRHSLNKPEIGENPGFTPTEQMNHKCKCRCRHNLRWIARSCI